MFRGDVEIRYISMLKDSCKASAKWKKVNAAVYKCIFECNMQEIVQCNTCRWVVYLCNWQKHSNHVCVSEEVDSRNVTLCGLCLVRLLEHTHSRVDMTSADFTVCSYRNLPTVQERERQWVGRPSLIIHHVLPPRSFSESRPCLWCEADICTPDQTGTECMLGDQSQSSRRLRG